MHLETLRIRNFRRLRDVRIDLARDISIFVGSNNSGKTSAAHAIQSMVAGARDKLALWDFSAESWRKFRLLTQRLVETRDLEPPAAEPLPRISLDLWFSVREPDLHLVLPLLPSTEWTNSLVGMRIEFAPKDQVHLLQDFVEEHARASERAAALAGGPNGYKPWPQSLSDYLLRNLSDVYEFKYFVLDRAQFDDEFVETANYEALPITNEPGGSAIIKSLLRVDCLSAQRHLADPLSGGATALGRAEDLSKRLSRFYSRNLKQREEDHAALRALSESERQLNEHFMDVFAATIKKIETLGYPGLANPRLAIRAGLDAASLLSQDARVHYVVGAGEDQVLLPDSYNGLGFKNLIYIVVEVLDLHERWVTGEGRPLLHLLFIEEPEAHLHGQLQQVFIRQVMELLRKDADDGEAYNSQVVVSTHSPHIVYERGFGPIRYFRRSTLDGQQLSEVINVSALTQTLGDERRDFLQRYLKLAHCDLFFADAVILCEGNVERLLLPAMIEKVAPGLRSACLCILEVGGAFAHRFEELIELIGVHTLVITDIDSVTVKAVTEADDDDVLYVDSAEGGDEKSTRAGSMCPPHTPGAVTSNQTLLQWIPKHKSIDDLFAVPDDAKCARLGAAPESRLRVAYQTPTPVTWNLQTENLAGRTLEEAFGLENAAWCQNARQRDLGLRMRLAPGSPQQLALGLHNRVNAPSFDKTKFALSLLVRADEEWVVPSYISQGLRWLEEQFQSAEAREHLAQPEIIAQPDLHSGNVTQIPAAAQPDLVGVDVGAAE